MITREDAIRKHKQTMVVTKLRKEDNSLFECKCGHMLFRQPEEFVAKYKCTKCSKIYIGEGNGKYKAKAKTREKKRA